MDLRQRKRQRLKNYDYSQNGAYFVTICTQNRGHLFGRIDNGQMILCNVGKMVCANLAEMSSFYPDIMIDHFVVMPNHLHAILLIHHNGTAQGPFPTSSGNGTAQGPFPTMGLSDYIHRFKTQTTRLYIDGVKRGDYPSFDKRVWQKSYHDHIIRNEQEYRRIGNTSQQIR